MAAVVNGASTASPGTKRKREDDEPTDAQTQRDILEILSLRDASSSFLEHAVESAGKERSPKKAKLSDSKTTISSKLSNGTYTSLKDLSKDAQHVSESLISAVREKAKDREGQNGRLLVEDLKEMQKAHAFEQLVRDVVEQEEKAYPVDKKSSTANGNGTVLTLFGNAPTPKQLFSSTQRTAAGAAEVPVEEMSLPTGLSATKIMAVPADSLQKDPTFEEAFAPPYNLPPLHPPKSHKRSSTRDETIKWEFKDALPRNKKGGYTTQSLTVGEWLGYGGVDSKDEPSSPREKRKLRDRVLSSGESTLPPPNRASLEDSMAKEAEALFRRAYSSFAPSHDNSKAVVPEEVKSMVWWNKVGHKRYHEVFAIDPALLDERPRALPEILPPPVGTLEDDDFEEVVEAFEEEEEETPGAEPSARDKTDVKEVLREISELLETLASHQRIRNASLHSSSSSARTPISPSPTILASRIGRPDSPAPDEVSTYQALRRELAYLVLKLPPYAVAKLDGDQFAKLGVRQLIPFRNKDVKGTMEEDMVARQAKQSAMATAAGIATLTRTGSGTPLGGSQHYSGGAARGAAPIGQAANTRYGQSGQYSASRPGLAQSSFNRPISSQSTYGTPSATAPRPGYGQPNQYSRPPSFQNGQHYYQRQVPTGAGYGGGYGQYGSSTPGSQQRPGFGTNQGVGSYQQRSQAAAQNAVAYQTNTQSPFNRPAYQPPPLQPSPAPRAGGQFQPPVQGGPTTQAGSTTPSSYPSQPQTPVNGAIAARPVAPRMDSASAAGTPQPQTQQGSSTTTGEMSGPA